MAVAKSASTTARSSRPRTWVWTLAALTCVLFGALLPYDMHEINQGVVSSLAVVCILIMSLWMHHIGAHDLPARGRELVPSRLGVVLLGYGATAVIAHEGLLAPLGLDLLSWWRDTAQRLPLSALAWAVPAILLAWRAPREIVRVLQDQPLARITLPLTGLVALGALAIAARHAAQPVDALGLRFYSADYGVVSLALLAAACRSRRHDEPWRLLGAVHGARAGAMAALVAGRLLVQSALCGGDVVRRDRGPDHHDGLRLPYCRWRAHTRGCNAGH